MACKGSDPPPPACTDGDTIEDDTVVPPEELNKTNVNVVPSTVYVEVVVVMDESLYAKIGKIYENGTWSSGESNSDVETEVKLYARKFMSAVNIKFAVVLC